MKKIAISLSLIAIVATVAVAGTVAYFSDEETSTGNVFTAGTIDIAVEGKNPWTQTATLSVEDMKPSQHEYTEYVIHNVGTNPANIFKMVHNVVEADGQISESECTYGNGIWKGNGVCTGSYSPIDTISSVVRYDMSVWVYNVDPEANSSANPIWWQVIYTDDMNETLMEIEDKNVLLGMLPAGSYMKVQQSYHMDANAGNEYQGDTMTFDITLTGEQLINKVVLENKIFPAGRRTNYCL
jgi:predicted ribosomally synthesized peptide with SipW-like signal peptide